MPSEYLDFVADVSTILNYGKSAAQVLTTAPDWKAKEGEHCFRYEAVGTGYNFYQYYWINSGWVYMKWSAAGTNAVYQWDPIQIPNDYYVALSDRQIESIKIALGAIGSDNIAIDAIYTDALSNSSITTVKVNTGAITTEKIAALAIEADNLAVNAVNASKIQANAIVVGHLSANAVTAIAISSTAITSVKLAANSITSTKIEAQAILASHLTAGEVVTLSAQIKDAIITNAKINDLNANKITAGSIAVYVLSQNSSPIASEKIILDQSRMIIYDTAGNQRVIIGKIS